MMIDSSRTEYAYQGVFAPRDYRFPEPAEPSRTCREAVPEAQELQHALRKRLRELECLWGVSRLIERHHDSLDRILQGIVELLPPAWQYPEYCCARLSLHGKSYTGGPFYDSAFRQTAAIRAAGQVVGAVEVCYSKRMPEADKGPFLAEERHLIDAVAGHVGTIVERFQAEQQFQAEREALHESNAALRGVLAEIKKEEKEIRESIVENVDRIIMPLLRALESEVGACQKERVALVRRHLEEITSPFANRLARAFAALTPLEIEICKMICDGLSTKEIARLRHVAPLTVAKHRERIRKKLGITSTQANLAAHLQTLGSWLLREGVSPQRGLRS